MTQPKHYLALDLGAESGRAILGILEKGKLTISEEHRFLTGADNLPTQYPQKGQASSSLVWDVIRFWNEIKKGIQFAGRREVLESVGVDTWGVDFALLDKNGLLLAAPYNYRDGRTDGMLEAAFSLMPKEEIYQISGIQFMPINTLYQLLSMSLSQSPLLQIADKFLMIPDLFNYWLTGKAVVEFTNATTTQCLDSRKRSWSKEILTAMHLPEHIFPGVVMPGTVLGALRPALQAELGCNPAVIVPATHDTGAAVSAVPAESTDYIWISSGTWSIVGMNTPEPVINALSAQYNFTNEGGLGGSFCFSKNVTGLWIIQQCRSQWQKEGKEFSYSDLTEMAGHAPHLKAFVDPDYNEFMGAESMVDKIRHYCRLTGQPVPENEGEVLRAALQGLALRYRYVVEKLEEVSGRRASVIHIIGGGSQNRLLNQFTADALGKKVLTGPVEATAIGNLMTQAIARGDITDWHEGVAVIRNSFDIETWLPGEQTTWNAAFEAFKINMEKIKLAF